MRERFVIECTNPAVTKGGLFFVSLVSSYFSFFRLSNQLKHPNFSFSTHPSFDYDSYDSMWCSLPNRGGVLAKRIHYSVPMTSFISFIKIKKTQTLVNEHKRAVTRFANRQLPRISFFFKHVINFAVDAMK